MKAEVKIGNSKYVFDFTKGKDISIPLIFNGPQPNTYHVNRAASEAYSDGQFIGDTRKGGPCNFETYSLTPHCNGTHTECIGHITKERVDILSALKDLMIPCQLISITPSLAKETYQPELNDTDLLITKEKLIKKLNHAPKEFMDGLIIRTLPNDNLKKSRDYTDSNPAFISNEAMKYLKSLGIKHLLIDTPSVDRLFDDGVLSSHNIFWDTIDKKFNTKTKNKTITELIFVEDSIPDGNYLLTIQIPAFISDAAPSRPIIFEINEL